MRCGRRVGQLGACRRWCNFRKKWGTTGAAGDDCAEVEAPVPGWRGMTLRQPPFQGIAQRAPLAQRGARGLLQELPLMPGRGWAPAQLPAR